MGKFVLRTMSLAVMVLLEGPVLAGQAGRKEVLAACARTKGCWTEPTGGGDLAGCSPNCCFYCQGDSCASLRHAPNGGKPSLGASDRISRLLLSNAPAR
jgi:hypothetical protein